MVSTFYPPTVIGGAEIVVSRQAEAMAKRGHEIAVITTATNPGPPQVELVDGVTIYHVSPFNLYRPLDYQHKPRVMRVLWHAIDLWNPDALGIVKGILKRERPDVVHVNNYKGFSLAVFQAAKSMHLPILFTAHDCSLICVRANLLRASGRVCERPLAVCAIYAGIQRRLVHGKVDLLTAPSQFAIDKLKSTGLFAGVKSVRLPPPVRTNCAMLEKTYEPIDVAYVGDISRQKGVQILIAAFKGTKAPGARLHIAGRGQGLEEMRTLAADDSRIQFPGFLTGDDLSALYRRASVLVVPSICYDNSPTVIYESLSFGTPVVASAIGGIPELVEEGHNGYLFEPGNIEQLKAILGSLVANPTSLEQLHKGSFESSKSYEMDKHLDQLEALYEDLANVAPGRSRRVSMSVHEK
jgi:glycosyltransferase involved in cell wall biosynthesis